ncbi:RdgB/HAM1 family non-canonical purine NTP pyrophosphatase [Alicyclobacillus fastidiosus]|uniref:dITP/XTP pyrophosphatase n=1 Tax=Alicyclobacillus fastidiosus TaxID=392011 RepID=A0ABV5AFN3_9BACL|nr:RdgB/HAM1 family non-canonical purine NTP pyrophosphatase [Alicyclobacillus fastidiosus]WEH11648.1 RdgB/HAM1 family non-canonical purine NTP pyrophosphatase [Alicyclobacillus fastidiosus]
MKLVIATHNAHKVEEFRGLLQLPGLDVAMLPQGVPDAPETGMTFVENANMKARFYADYVDDWVLSDDSGLEVPLLGGEPGIYSARYAGVHGDDAANNAKLIARLHEHGQTEAEASFVCALAVYHKGTMLASVEGRVAGTIYDRALGQAGFGYDPLFQPSSAALRFAEMTPEQKAEHSHRAAALRLLAPLLKEWLD